jgi:hypothetical protein
LLDNRLEAAQAHAHEINRLLDAVTADTPIA